MGLTYFRLAASYAAGLFTAAIFVDSLRFKFAGHPTPEHIFTTLRDWSGISLFYPAGPWIIGLAELMAAIFILAVPLVARFIGLGRMAALIQSAGAGIGLGVMSGAIGFHLFTPLGIETPVDWSNGEILATSPALFIAACITWLCCALILVLRGGEALGQFNALRKAA
jgi:hypothetical protein